MMLVLARWKRFAWQALGFAAAAACGSLLVSALQSSTAHATSCMTPHMYGEWLHLEKRGVEPLGPPDDPGDPSGVNAQWPESGGIGMKTSGGTGSLEFDFAEPWIQLCRLLERVS